MSKYFVYDPQFASDKALLSPDKFAKILNQSTIGVTSYLISDPPKSILSPKITYDETTGLISDVQIVVNKGLLITVGNSIFRTDEDIVLDTTTCATEYSNTNQFTSKYEYFDTYPDMIYYIYIYDPFPTQDCEPQFVIVNSSSRLTNIYQYDNDQYKLLGGFVYGLYRNVKRVTMGGKYIHVLANSSGEEYGSNWQTNTSLGIVYNSIWDLSNRPRCNPDDMVKINNRFWADRSIVSSITRSNRMIKNSVSTIYEIRLNYNNLISSKNTDYQTTDLNWYGFIEYASLMDKRLPTYEEYCIAVYGTPEGPFDFFDVGDHVEHTGGTNPFEGQIYTRSDKRCISFYNIYDLVDLVPIYTSNLCDLETVMTYGLQTTVADLQVGGLGYDEDTSTTKISRGRIYGPNGQATSMRVICAGKSSTDSGKRSITVEYTPWQTGVAGAWLVCDSYNTPLV